MISQSSDFTTYLQANTEKYKQHFSKLPHQETIAETMTLLDKIKKDFNTMDEAQIIKAAVDLAVLKSSLGDYAAHQNWKANNAYVYKKLRRASERYTARERLREVGLKDTQDNIDAEVTRATEEEEINLISQQYYTDKCKSLHDSISHVINALGWKLKQVASEKRDLKYEQHMQYGTNTR